MEDETETPGSEVAQPTMAQTVAELVRGRSRAEGKLTRLDALDLGETPLDGAQQEDLVAQILADEQCQDIKLLRTSGGAVYLYSGNQISDTYARILLRVEEDNPYETIASTVREESETYPRPTPVAQFRDPTFGLVPDQVQQLVTEMLQLEQYSDVKLVKASTGALYLYSERYLDGEWAKSLVEWEEVGIRENP